MASSDLDFEDTSHDDLSTGLSPWGSQEGTRPDPPKRVSLTDSIKTDVAVIGAGITGALAAEHLTSLGHQVVVIDREQPGFGSTRASTAMLQWETDSSLTELTEFYGFDAAADIYRRSYAAVSGLSDLVSTHRLPCAFDPRSTLYLAAADIGEKELREELALRHRAGLPGGLLSYDALFRERGFDREAAILSPGSAEADPLLLAWSLLRIAASRGAKVIDADALNFHDEGRRVVVETSGQHVIEAAHVVLATGYVMPHFVMPACHTISSSFALATVPQQPDQLWSERALIWEAAEPYIYMRMTADNRIIFGGEDEEIADPQARDALLWDKTMRLKQKLLQLWPKTNATISHAWCGAFGETSDGLPLIGPVPGASRIFAAYGYGGNGITFSYLASRMIAAMISGDGRDWFDRFALDRDVKKAG
ncbi:FAD-binding oxidoreductase [Aliirhizobium terrae]|uniref:NAD(P)/FAD-dependent oxidoreductase n=1 Tax=Terrirhizobium terrae TaxID=2926709 RepID=UPI0025781CD9|nr:FAD-binding oxidoreductase [Rhizobium sp. CC-CFT758]WJH39330.1 FAD-binding oxidoreductase [Rhizobium sp. CC-CFT758]